MTAGQQAVFTRIKAYAATRSVQVVVVPIR